MKKIILLVIINFLFINNAHAATIDEQLLELNNNVTSLATRVENSENTELDKMHPIGSIYITTEHSNIQQVENAIGGVWEIYNKGKTLVGVDENDTNFNEVNKTGGNSKTILSISNLPNHSHEISSLTGTAELSGIHTHIIPSLTGTTNKSGIHNHDFSKAPLTWPINDPKTADTWPNWSKSSDPKTNSIPSTANAGEHFHTITTQQNETENEENHTHDVTIPESVSETTGNNAAFTNLQPYITVYMYKRIG